MTNHKDYMYAAMLNHLRVCDEAKISASLPLPNGRGRFDVGFEDQITREMFGQLVDSHIADLGIADLLSGDIPANEALSAIAAKLEAEQLQFAIESIHIGFTEAERVQAIFEAKNADYRAIAIQLYACHLDHMNGYYFN